MIRERAPALIFLDIQMPNLNGVEILELLVPASRPEVIFVTAHQAYAQSAFDLYAVDFLLKPFSTARFVTALDRAKRRLADGVKSESERALKFLLKELKKGRQPEMSENQATASAPQDNLRIIVKVDRQLHFIIQREIRWVQAQGDFVKIHLKSRSFLVRLTMGKVEKMLDPSLFSRIHKSTIVNMANVRRVKSIMASSRGMELDDGTTLAIGASYRGVLVGLKHDL
jgi:two-component system LytT family response regulator